jgi:hypothetical protein
MTNSKLALVYNECLKWVCDCIARFISSFLNASLVKNSISYLIIGLLFIGLGCKQKVNKINVNPDWTSLTIDEEDHSTVITINKQGDTSDVKFNDYGSIFTGVHKAKIDSLKTYFTKAEKDTIYSLVEDIIANPIRPKAACTDFVGDINLTIYFGNLGEPGTYKQSIAYSGVCRWDTLSTQTKRLAALLKRKIYFKNK